MTEILGPEANFLGLTAEQSDLATARAVVLPAPYEATSSFGRGSSGGPAAILAASREVELFDAALGCEPWQATGGIATLAPLDAGDCDGAAFAERLRAAVADQLAHGRFVVTLGGEHTSIVGAIRAHCAHFADLTVLQLDAHSDLRPDYLGDPWSHASAMARVLDFHDHVVAVGIRSQAVEERGIQEARGLPTFYAHTLHDELRRGEDWAGRVVAATRPNVYVTLDCDVLDPSVMPATGTPEPGGLGWYELDELLARLCRERNLVGLDTSELAPVRGLHHPQFTAAKLIYRILAYRTRGR